MSKYRYSSLAILLFAVLSLTGQSINIVSPNGGEIWESGKKPHISWKSVGVRNVDLDYSADGGQTWSAIDTSQRIENYTSKWEVADTLSEKCLIRVTDSDDPSVFDVSDQYFSIHRDDGVEYNIVVLGSSTAAGNGPTVKDSAWAWKYEDHLFQMNTNVNLINLAKGGFTTYDLLPDGYPMPPILGRERDGELNISNAMSYHPDAIIINLPSNDARKGFPVLDQLKNYDILISKATFRGVPVWLTTPQPRNDLDESTTAMQLQLLDSTYSVFGDFAIDFWTDFTVSGSLLKWEYDSGDGIHMNNPGHQVLTRKLIDAGIFEYITSAVPVTKVLLDRHFLLMEAGSSTQLGAFALPINANDRSLTWASDQNSVAAVDQNGQVTGISDGETNITATTNDGAFTDTCLVTIQNTSGLKKEAILVSRIYPNPVLQGDFVTISTSYDQESSILIRDISGRALYSKNVNGDGVSISTSGFSSGIYFICLSSDKGSENLKLIVK